MTFGCKWKAETQGSAPPRNDDPYGTWLLGHGSDFSIRSRISKEAAADFSHELVMSTVKQAETGNDSGANDNGALQAQEGRDKRWARWADRKPGHLTETALMPGADRTPEADGPRELLRIPAPLRDRSVGTGDISRVRWDLPRFLEDLSPDQRRTVAGKIVVMAVMDDGMNIAHDSFRGPDGASRVEFAWIQDGTADNRLKFGREWHRSEIEARIRQSGGDEDRLLKALDLVTFERQNTSTVARRVSHGTHMMDLAAGYPREDFTAYPPGDPSKLAEAMLRPIISVHLPFLMTQEASGATYGPFVQQGLRYIFQRVRDMSEALGVILPVVINFSYAVSAGPHNGTHLVERQICQERAHHLNLLANMNLEEVVSPRKAVTVVLPAGNRHQARGHALVESNGGDATTLELPWRIQPGDQTSSYLEIWLSKDAENIRVTIQAPGAEPGQFSIPGTPDEPAPPRLLCAPGSGDVIARLSMDLGIPGHSQTWPHRRRRILLAVAPTDVDWIARAPAPSGVWKITVTAKIAPEERIEAWVQRDESPYRFRANARQSYLDDGLYQRFNADGTEKEDDITVATDLTGGKIPARSVVRREGTLSGMATGKHITVVGALREKDRQPSSYSAAGNMAAETDAVRDTPGPDDTESSGKPAKIRGPRYMDVADRSRVRSGVLASGSRSGSVVAITGTSAAAPQVARDLAQAIASSPPNDPDETISDAVDRVAGTATPSGDPRRKGQILTRTKKRRRHSKPQRR